MLISKQQRCILDALERLGCLREDQLTAMIRSAFCAAKPEIAPIVTAAALRQLTHCIVGLHIDAGVCGLRDAKPDETLLEAVDVMLQLAGNGLTDYWRGNPPVLLRFCVQGPKVRTFSVAEYGPDIFTAAFPTHERVILLFDGQSQPQALPVSNKQFFAVRQGDGTYRFFVPGGKQQT